MTTPRLKSVTVSYQDNGEGLVEFIHEHCVEFEGELRPMKETRAAIRLEDLRAQTLDLPLGAAGQRTKRPGTFIDELFEEIAAAQRRDAEARAAANAEAEARATARQAEIEARAKQLEVDREQAAADAEAEQQAVERQFAGKAKPA